MAIKPVLFDFLFNQFTVFCHAQRSALPAEFHKFFFSNNVFQGAKTANKYHYSLMDCFLAKLLLNNESEAGEMHVSPAIANADVRPALGNFCAY